MSQDENPPINSINEPVGSNVRPSTTATASPQKKGAAVGKADPDEMEEELDAAVDDGDVEPTHRGVMSKILPKRKK